MRFHSAITYRLGRVGVRGETTTRLPAWRCSPAPVVWTCRTRRHVAFPPPAAIAILSFPSGEGSHITASQHRGGAMGSEFRGDATGLPLSCCLLPPRGFVFCQTCCPCIQQAQPTPAVCRALSPCFCSRCPQSAGPSCAPPVAAVVPLLQAPAPVHTG